METSPSGLHILLADDDKDDRFFFDKALKEIPMETRLTTVQNGEELMEYLNNNLESLPDILFLDLSMHRKTGFQCLSDIKENKNLKELQVIMFSTSFTRGIDFERNIIKTLRAMGAEDYIRKPADFKELKSAIHHAIVLATERISLRKNERIVNA